MPNNSSAGSEILSRLQQAPTIHPASASLFTDWSLEPGDVVTVKSDEEAYMVPIYTMLMEWTGAPKVDISSSGNQKREPLPALTRRDYATRSAINGMRQKMEDQEEINQQYQHWRTETNQQLTSVYKITGVKLDRYGRPIYQQAKDSQGNPLWETDAQGNPVYDTDLQGNIIYETDEHGNYVLDEHGNKIPRKKPVYVLDEAGNPVPVYDPDSTGSISSSITQTAQSLNILYEQTGGVTEQFDKEKQYHAGDYVLSPNGVSCRFKVDHLGPWNNEDVVSVPNLQAQITTNANEISNRVTITSLTQTLGSYITQDAYSASIGAFLDENGKVSAAKIVTAINAQTGESKVSISGDIIELQGSTIISLLSGGAIDVYSVTASEVIATDLMFDEGGESYTETSFTETTLGNKTNPQKIKFLGDGGYSQATTITYADFPHYHEVSIDNSTGKITIGGVTASAPSPFDVTGTTWYANQISAAESTGRSSVTVYTTAGSTLYSPAWGTATASDDQTKAHGKKYTIGITTLSLGYYTTEEQETGPGSTETVQVWHQTGTVAIPAHDITDVYEAGIASCAITDLSATSIGGNHLVENVTIKASGTNLSDYSETAALANTTYTVGSLTRHCVTLSMDSHVIGRISTEDVYTAGQNRVMIAEPPVWNNSTVTGHENTLQVSTSGRGTEDVKYWSVSASSLTLTKGSLTKATVSGSTVDYAGSYRISRSGGGIVSVKGVQTSIYAGVTALTLALELAEPTVSHSWDNTNHVYTYEKSASLTVDGTANVLTRSVTTGLTLTPTEAINHGFDVCHDSIGLSASTQTLAAGTSLTIYPKAKASATASSASNITTAGITITAEAATVSGDVDVDGPYWAGTTATASRKVTFSPASGNGDSAEMTLTLSAYASNFSWANGQYTYTVTGNVNDGNGVKLTKATSGLVLTPTDAINYGKTLVNVSSATLSNIVANSSARTATASLTIYLDNNKSKTVDNVDVSSIYQAGLDGSTAITNKNFSVKLADNNGNGTVVKTDVVSVDVSDVYQQGVDDAAPVVSYRYIYSTTNNGRCRVRTAANGETLGWVYANTKVEYISTSGSWVQISYGGYTGWVADNLVHTSSKSGVSVVESGWETAPGGGTTPVDPDPTKVVDSYVAISAVHSSVNLNKNIRIYVQMKGSTNHTTVTSSAVNASNWNSARSGAESNSSNVTDVYHYDSDFQLNLPVVITYQIWYTDNTYEQRKTTWTSEAF